MDKLFSEFSIPSFEDWKKQLIKELKDTPESALTVIDSIEDLEYTCYQHEETTNHLPDYHISTALNNDWLNFGLVEVIDEESANAKALNLLNSGADALRFDLKKQETDFQKLTKGIEFQYIQTRFCIHSLEQFKSVQSFFSEEDKKYISLEIDLIGNNDLKKHQAEILSSNSFPTFLVANGYSLQQCGANTWQEIGYCLSSAHEYLVLLTENGIELEKAAKSISFNIGVGANYFMEIAKVRVLRFLWNEILQNYDPSKTFETCKIYGMVGFTNKSLKDPHTNLLRQTTEAMSLISGGVTGIMIQSYAAKSIKNDNSLAERMAINIPLILKEESYFHAVQDPQGGSYSVKLLSHLIAEKAWSYFQSLDGLGGVLQENAIQKLTSDVLLTAEKRIQLLNEKEDVLIGVSIFPNPENESNEWTEKENYLGMETLVLEKTYNVFAS